MKTHYVTDRYFGLAVAFERENDYWNAEATSPVGGPICKEEAPENISKHWERVTCKRCLCFKRDLTN